MHLFNLLQLPNALATWTLLLIASALLLLLASSVYMVAWWRSRRRSWQATLSVLCLLVVVGWSFKVCSDVYHIYQVYQAYQAESGPSPFGTFFIVAAPTGLSNLPIFSGDVATLSDTVYGPSYVYQLYILLFLSGAICALLLRHMLKLQLKLARLSQAVGEMTALQQKDPQREETFTEDTEIPAHYTVEVVNLNQAQRLSLEYE
jgi:hypothetical protein